MTRDLAALLCATVGLALAVLWLFAETVQGFAIPAWVPPSSVVAGLLGLMIAITKNRV